MDYNEIILISASAQFLTIVILTTVSFFCSRNESKMAILNSNWNAKAIQLKKAIGNPKRNWSARSLSKNFAHQLKIWTLKIRTIESTTDIRWMKNMYGFKVNNFSQKLNTWVSKRGEGTEEAKKLWRKYKFIETDNQNGNAILLPPNRTQPKRPATKTLQPEPDTDLIYLFINFINYIGGGKVRSLTSKCLTTIKTHIFSRKCTKVF